MKVEDPCSKGVKNFNVVKAEHNTEHGALWDCRGAQPASPPSPAQEDAGLWTPPHPASASRTKRKMSYGDLATRPKPGQLLALLSLDLRCLYYKQEQTGWGAGSLSNILYSLPVKRTEWGRGGPHWEAVRGTGRTNDCPETGVKKNHLKTWNFGKGRAAFLKMSRGALNNRPI